MSLARHTDGMQSTLAPPRFGRKPVIRHTAIVARIPRLVAKAASLFTHAVRAIAEARMHRAAIETELYLNRYRHTSKNDDDLPVVRRVR